MNLKEYAESINKLAEKYPDVLVVSASDDAGNSFQKVNYAGTLGFFEGEYHGTFVDERTVKKYPEEESYEQYVGKQPNAVCIN